MNRRLVSISNRIGAWLYRTSDGRIGGGPAVIVLTTPGRKSGLLRSTCVRYVRTGEGYVVWGTGSGSPKVPDWFLNLRHAGKASVQFGDESRDMLVRELDGAERDDVWHNVVLREVPGIARFAEMSGRTIPVAVLK